MVWRQRRSARAGAQRGGAGTTLLIDLAVAALAVTGCSSTTATEVPQATKSVPTAVGTDAGYPDDDVDGELFILPPDQPGGSSVHVAFPCESGRAIADLRPDGQGVTLTETLRGVAQRKWQYYATVSPYVAPNGDPSLTTVGVHRGDLTITATNLRTTQSLSVNKANHAWPQVGDIELYGKHRGNCSAHLFLSATRLQVYTAFVVMQAYRDTGTIDIGDGAPAFSPSPYEVSITVWSPSGVDHRSTRMRKFKQRWDIKPELTSTLTDVPHLNDFTKLTITMASTDGTDRHTVTVTRTP